MQINKQLQNLSSSEKKYIIDSINQSSLRIDGRGLLDSLPNYLELSNLKQCSGSSRIRLQDKTDVVVGIKLEVEPILPTDVENFNKGKLELEVECSSSSSQKLDKKQLEYFTQYLKSGLTNLLFTGENLDTMLKNLCIIEGSARWVVYIDVLILGIGGNLLDTISYSIRSALSSTQLPFVKIEDMGEGYQKAYEVSDDPSLFQKLPNWQDVPISVSLTKIGDKFILDPTDLEESCAEVSIHFAVNSNGDVLNSFKSVDGAISPTMLVDMIQAAKKLGKSALKSLDEACKTISQEVQTDTQNQNHNSGFLA